MDKKIKIVFDATVLANALDKASYRSGIFFTAYNILKELRKKENCDIDLWCYDYVIDRLRKVSSSNVLGKDVNIINESFWLKLGSKIGQKIGRLAEKKTKKKEEKKKVAALILQLRLLPLFMFRKLVKKICSNYFRKYDVYFSPMLECCDYIKSLDHIKRYVILYDVTPLLFPNYFMQKIDDNYWLVKLIKSMRKSDHYFAISECTKKDFLEHVDTVSNENITVSYLACDEKFKPCSDVAIKNKVLDKYKIPRDKKYMFSLCSLEPRKNLIRIVKTFIDFISKHKIEDMVYVLGGDAWEGFISLLERQVPNLQDYSDKILKIGYVDDEDLASLYSGAQWFVYTSQYEGFGLPPLEAMSCGCPVITSNNSSLPEVVGDAGIMIDWDNDEQHVKAYETYYFNKDKRDEYAKRGLERAKFFSWEKCGDSIYNKIMLDLQK